jgi:glutathione S-transferase
MPYVELVALLAVVQYLFFGAMTGKARRESGLKAPAIAGHQGFERMYRVQMNTLETLVAFLPCLLLAAPYVNVFVVAGLGLVYLIGRFIYWRAYVADPSKRALGFMLSMVSTMALAAIALVGIVMAIVR